MAVWINEQIKASEVQLTGLQGEDLGVVSREEAMSIAREAGADLVCTSLMSGPPPCRLTAKGKGREAAQKEAAAARQSPGTGKGAGAGGKDKVKELRFTAHIEEHDYDTKLRQADKLLRCGSAVQLVVKASGAKDAALAKSVLERLVTDLKESGQREFWHPTAAKARRSKSIPCNAHRQGQKLRLAEVLLLEDLSFFQCNPVSPTI